MPAEGDDRTLAVCGTILYRTRFKLTKPMGDEVNVCL